jgi:protein SCO1/2
MALGFTHCPDVCPDTLQRLSQAMAEAGDTADAVRVLFVSVDPERDSPSLLRDYVQSFDPRIVPVTGTPAQLARLYRSLDITVRKVATATGYSLDHPLQVYMVDAAGAPAGIVRYVDTPAQVAAKMRKLAGR